MPGFIRDFDELISNVREYQRAVIRPGTRINPRLVLAWYYIPALDMVAPSRFIGYQGMTGAIYDVTDQVSGTETEVHFKSLGWFRQIKPGDQYYSRVLELAQSLCSPGDVNHRARLLVLRDEYDKKIRQQIMSAIPEGNSSDGPTYWFATQFPFVLEDKGIWVRPKYLNAARLRTGDAIVIYETLSDPNHQSKRGQGGVVATAYVRTVLDPPIEEGGKNDRWMKIAEVNCEEVSKVCNLRDTLLILKSENRHKIIKAHNLGSFIRSYGGRLSQIDPAVFKSFYLECLGKSWTGTVGKLASMEVQGGERAKREFWWVNQNQTHAQEIPGGYMWSPKQKKDGTKNIFYDNMAKVLPGDLVFSFFDTFISYVGIITSHGYTEPKPNFGGVGEVWENEGWMVNVDYRQLRNKIQPREHIDVLMPLLPNKYSPLQKNGNGNQIVYLTNIPELLAKKIAELIGEEVEQIFLESKEHQGELKTDREAEAERIEKLIRKNKDITETEKEVLIKARKGQGKFRDDVLSLHKKCPFTGVSNPIFLTAGHLKPWSRCSDNQERLDPLNGLPLSPVADQLVDQGFVTFDDNGIAVFSNQLDASELKDMGISLDKKYRITIFDPRQLKYLKYHRDTFINKNI